MNPFKAVMNSFVGALLGLALFAGSFVLIFWNENRSVQTARSLHEGRKVVEETPADRVNGALDGKLVYVSHDAKAPGPLVDSATGISLPALSARRESEMYQWVETSEGRSGGSERKYRYASKWESRHHDSSRFHDRTRTNPSQFRVPGGSGTVRGTTMGAFQVPGDILKEIAPTTFHLLAEKDLASLPEALRPSARLHEGWLYLGENPREPKVGDERVRFKIVPPGPISVVAMQKGAGLAEYRTSNGYRLVLAEAGEIPMQVLFDHAITRNTVLTWGLRMFGFLLMFGGARLIISPLTRLTDWIPFLGGLVNAGATLAAGALTMVLSASTIAVAWFAVRPVMSLSIAGGGAAIFWLLKRFGRGR